MSLESLASLESRAGAAQDWMADEAALLERAARLARDERLGRLLHDALIAVSHRISRSEYES